MAERRRSTPVTLEVTHPSAVDRAIATLRGGGLVAVPTETVYGLCVLPEPGPLERLVVAKGRPPAKGVALLVDSWRAVLRHAEPSETARRLAARFWPGPLTLVLPVRSGTALPELVTGGRQTVAFRMPDHPLARRLASDLGPLCLTSANRSGEPEATTAADVARALDGAIDLVLDGGPSRSGVASTVVLVAPDGAVEILRTGELGADDIRDALT